MSVPRPTSPESRSARARLGSAVRHRGPEHPDALAARAAYESESYVAAVAAAVADPPPLTAEQRARLRKILASVPVDGAA